MFFSCMPLQFAYKIKLHYDIIMCKHHSILFMFALQLLSKCSLPSPIASSSERVPLGFHVTYVFGEFCLDQDSTGEKNKTLRFGLIDLSCSTFLQTPSVPSESPSPSISYTHIFFLNLDSACKEKHRMIFVSLGLAYFILSNDPQSFTSLNVTISSSISRYVM